MFEIKDESGNPIRNLRNLNLSYNSLFFDETSTEPLPSDEFVDHLVEFINTSTKINHLDISGMKLGRDFNPESFNNQYELEGHTSSAPIL